MAQQQQATCKHAYVPGSQQLGRAREQQQQQQQQQQQWQPHHQQRWMQAAVAAESGEEEPSKTGDGLQAEEASSEGSGVTQPQKEEAAPWWRL